MISTSVALGTSGAAQGDDLWAMGPDIDSARLRVVPAAGQSGVGVDVGLDSQFPLENFEVGLALDHRTWVEPAGQAVEIGGRTRVSGQLTGVDLVPGGGLSADLFAEYARGAQAFEHSYAGLKFSGRLVRGTSVSASSDWRAQRVDGKDWAHVGRARLSVRRVVAGAAEIGAFGRIEARGAPAPRPRYATGLDIRLRDHALHLIQHIEPHGGRATWAPGVSSVYVWRTGGVGVAIAADYAPATMMEPPRVFAGFSLTLGGDADDPRSDLERLR